MVDGCWNLMTVSMFSNHHRFLDGKAQDRLILVVPSLNEGWVQRWDYPGTVFIRPEGVDLTLLNAPSSQESLHSDVS